MRELSVSDCKTISGAISTADIMNFFKNFGRKPVPPVHFDDTVVPSDPVPFGVAAPLGAAALVIGGAFLFSKARQ